MRPEDVMVAGYNLQRVAKLAPDFLPPVLRGAIARLPILETGFELHSADGDRPGARADAGPVG